MRKRLEVMMLKDKCISKAQIRGFKVELAPLQRSRALQNQLIVAPGQEIIQD